MPKTKKRGKSKEYYSPDEDYTRETRDQTSKSEWWKPDKKHKNHIRVLPAWDERGICIVRRVMHFGFEEGGRNRAFPCLEDNMPWLDKTPCPICHVVSKMVKGDRDEKEAAADLKVASPRFLVQLIDCTDIEAGVQLWAGPTSFGKYFLSLLEDEDIEDITHPEEGYDIYFEVSGSGRGTSYDYRLRAKSTPIPYDNWEDELQDLLETIEVRDLEELVDLLEDNYGNAFDIKEYLSDFEGGGKKGKKGKKKSKKRDEEEEEEKEPRKKGGKRRKKEEEEEEKEYTAEEIADMNKRKLLKLIKGEDLPIEDDDWDSLKELRELIMDELDIEEEEED